MKLLFQALAYISMGMVPLAASQPTASEWEDSQCEDGNGVVVGDSGQIAKKNSTDGVLFRREGGANCGCSYVSRLE